MKKLLYIIITTTLISSSCSKFLEPFSQTEYIPKTTEAIQELLIGNAYPVVTLSTIDKGSNLLGVFLSLDPDIGCSDYNYTPTSTLEPSYECIIDMLYSYSPDLPQAAKDLRKESIYNIWTNYYSKILGCNAALDYVDGVTGTDMDKDFIKAQAYTLRAFYYFTLANIHCPAYTNDPKGLGLVLKTDSKMVDFNRTRSTVQETYDLIVDDLNKAEAIFKRQPQERWFKPDYMVSLPMIYMMQARVNLYMKQWDKAAKYAGLIIDNFNFEILDLNSIPAPEKITPPVASTTPLQYYDFMSYATNSECIWLWGNIDSYTELLLKTRIGKTEGNSSAYKRNFLIPSDDFMSKFVNGDLRKDRYLVRESYSTSSGTNTLYTVTSKVAVDNMNRVLTNRYACSFRLSEVYLIKAEAIAEMRGDVSEVYSLMNKLRIKRFSLETYKDMPQLTGDELIEFVRNERRLELCFESGHRFFDMRRWNLGFKKLYNRRGANINLEFEPNDLCLTLPIPITAYEINPAIKQNPRGEVKLDVKY